MKSDHHDAVLAQEAKLLEAMLSGNAELLETLLHDDLLFNGPTGQTATKAMDLANYRAGVVRLQSVQASNYLLASVDDVVVVAVTVALQGNYAGQEIDGRFRYLRVWKMTGSGWRVIAGSVGALEE